MFSVGLMIVLIMKESNAFAAIDLADLTVELCTPGGHGALVRQALAQACLDRIRPTIPLQRDHSPNLLRLASARDRPRRAAGECLWSLAGVPVVIKDPMTWGFPPPRIGPCSIADGRGGSYAAFDAPVSRECEPRARECWARHVPVLSSSGTHATDSWPAPL